MHTAATIKVNNGYAINGSQRFAQLTGISALISRFRQKRIPIQITKVKHNENAKAIKRIPIMLSPGNIFGKN